MHCRKHRTSNYYDWDFFSVNQHGVFIAVIFFKYGGTLLAQALWESRILRAKTELRKHVAAGVEATGHKNSQFSHAGVRFCFSSFFSLAILTVYSTQARWSLESRAHSLTKLEIGCFAGYTRIFSHLSRAQLSIGYTSTMTASLCPSEISRPYATACEIKRSRSLGGIPHSV